MRGREGLCRKRIYKFVKFLLFTKVEGVKKEEKSQLRGHPN